MEEGNVSFKSWNQQNLNVFTWFKLQLSFSLLKWTELAPLLQAGRFLTAGFAKRKRKERPNASIILYVYICFVKCL